MRPVKRAQGAFAHPLNAILGTEANVRVLRVLLLSDIPVGITDLARRSALQASGLARICAKLEDLGVIESVGRGRTRQFRRSQRGEIANWLATLFSQEQQRANAIIEEIRRGVLQVGPPRSVWIEGPVAQHRDAPGDPIIIGVLLEAADIERSRQQLWAELLSIQQRRDVSLELRTYTEADLRTSDRERLQELESALPLVGAPPFDIAKPRAPVVPDRATHARSHVEADADLLRLASAIANRIRRDPSLIEDARTYIDRRLLSASSGEQLELREWSGVLSSMSPARIRRLLVQDDARARRLRQSMPFLNVLSVAERAELLKKRAKR